MTPYREVGELSSSDLNFNYKLSKSRVVIENAFGLLKQRFRQLVRLYLHHVDSMSKFVISCCVLHNLCIYAKDPLDDTEIHLEGDEHGNRLCDDDEFNHNERVLQTPSQERHEKHAGSRKRDSIKDELFIHTRR